MDMYSFSLLTNSFYLRYVVRAMQNLLDGIKQYLIFILLGSIGGVAYQLLYRGQRVSFWDILRGAFVSGFTGLMAGLGASHMGVGEEATYLVAGLLGFAGGFGLLWLLAAAMKRFDLSPSDVADLASAMHGLHDRKEPARSLVDLVQGGVLSRRDYSAIMGGDISILLRIHEEGRINDQELIMLLNWKHILTRREGREQGRRHDMENQ